MNKRFKIYIFTLVILLAIITYHLVKSLQNAERFACTSKADLALCTTLETQLKSRSQLKPNQSDYDTKLAEHFGTYAEKNAKLANAKYNKSTQSSKKQIKNTNYKYIEFTTSLRPAKIKNIINFVHAMWTTHKILPTYILLKARDSQPHQQADKWTNTITFSKTFYSPKK